MKINSGADWRPYATELPPGAEPDGIPPAIWDNMPAELQAQLREAVAMGAKLWIKV